MPSFLLSEDSVEKLAAWMMIMAVSSCLARGDLVELSSSDPIDFLYLAM
jgi:hypothetical protein